MTHPLASLVAAATSARVRAHAPYSRFLVGAALRCDGNGIHAGCNVENAAYPQGTCAEAGAIAAMVLAGGKRILEVVISVDGTAGVPPCGGCRQKIREFASPETPITMVDATGKVLMVTSLGELLPHSFGPDNLGVSF